MDAVLKRRRIAAPLLRPRSARAGWAWPATALLVLAALMAPFFVTEVPAVLDYPNHLARFYILAHPHDPVLSRMYAPHWSILPNLGADLLGAGLLRLLPVHVGGRMLLALSLLAPLAGTVLHARAAHGRWTWWSLGAGVIGFNGMFFLGFMNFLLGVGVALAGAAAWRVLRRRAGPAATALAAAAIGLVAFFCHLLGFALFGLLIGAQEIEALVALRREGRLHRSAVIRTAALLAATVGPTLALYLLTHHGLKTGDVLLWRWGDKLVEWMTPFYAYDLRLTALTAIGLLIVGLVVARRARPAAGVGLALVALAALFVVAPYQAAGGAVLDARFAVMAAFLVFAGLDPHLPAIPARAVAAALVALGAGRSAEAAVDWHGRGRDLAELRSVAASVAPGARVLSARTGFADGAADRRGRRLSGFFRMDDNLPALLVIERRAFWPLLFADPSQQPLLVRPPYDRIAGVSQARPPDWRDLARDRALPFADWRRFDYVLVMGPAPPVGGAPRGLSLARAGAAASLYRVDP